MKQLIPAQSAGMAIIPRYKKVQATIQHNSQEVQGKSTHEIHSMRTANLKSVQAQKAYIQPDTIAGREKDMLCVTMITLLALWIYALFRRSKYYPNSKNQGGFLAKQALRFDRMLTAF